MQQMRAVVVILAMLPASGCSYIGMRGDRAPYAANAQPDCDKESQLPLWDVGGAAASLGMAGVFTADAAAANVLQPQPGQSDSERRLSSAGMAAAMAALATGVAVSSVYGFRHRSQCREAWVAWEPVKKKQDEARRLAEITAKQQAEADSAAAAERERVAAEQEQKQQAERAAAAEAQAAKEAQARADAEEAEAKRTAPLLAELNKLDGFQGARWGMSKAQVKAVFPQAGRSENKMFFKGKVAGFPATTTLFFAQDKLKSVAVDFDRTNKVGSQDELFQSLLNALEEKYGPSRDTDHALGAGRFWLGARTGVVLLNHIASQNLGSAATINYESVELRNLIEDVSKKAKKDL